MLSSTMSRYDSTNHAERQSDMAQHFQTQVATLQRVENQLQTVIRGHRQILQHSEQASDIQTRTSSQMQSEKLMLEAVRSRLQSLMENLEQSLAGVERYSLTMPTQFSLRSHWTKFGVTGEGLDEMLEALPREERNNCETAWECLKALFVTDPEVDMREIENRRDYLIPHSCDWAVKQASDYLENPSFNRLWIYGEPGKGKTHIALALVKHLQVFIAEKLKRNRHDLMVDLVRRGDKIIFSFLSQLAGSRYRISQPVADRISFRSALCLQKVVKNISSAMRPPPRQFLERIARRMDSYLIGLVKNSSNNAEIIPTELVTKVLEKGDSALKIIENEQADRMKKISKGFLGYFFCDSTSDQRNDLVYVLRSLLRQVLQQVLNRRRNTTDSSKAFLASFRSKGSKMFLSVESLWTELQRILGDAEFNHACFIVDGLDECETNSKETFLSLLRDQRFQKTHEQPDAIVHRHLQVKWILLSRKSYFRADCFGQHTLAMDLQNNSTNIETSVAKYIDIKVNELSKAKGYGSQLELSVRKILREKAQGTFLWVALACRELRRTAVRSIHTIPLLNKLPVGLSLLYTRIYDEVMGNEYEDVAKYTVEILRAVVLATRPLSIGELAIVAGLPTDIQKELQLAEEYVEQCGSFLSILRNDTSIRGKGSDTVHLVHHSAKDFLLFQRHEELFSPACILEHERIALRCLRYLDNITFASNRFWDYQKAFSNHYEYPLKYWIDHGNMAPQQMILNKGGNSQLFRKDSLLQIEWLKAFASTNNQRSFVAHFSARDETSWIVVLTSSND
jgi:hypothetical protein